MICDPDEKEYIRKSAKIRKGHVKRDHALNQNFVDVPVIQSKDAESIYSVPLLMAKEHLDEISLEKLRMPNKDDLNLADWNVFLNKLKNPNSSVNIGYTTEMDNWPFRVR